MIAILIIIPIVLLIVLPRKVIRHPALSVFVVHFRASEISSS
jgi:hypothetical protein